VGWHEPFGGPLFVVTHRLEDEPPAPESGFVFVGSFEEALGRAQEAAGDKDVSISVAPTSSAKGSTPAWWTSW
jgi:hypothetical protein